jgi:hypothetical protein
MNISTANFLTHGKEKQQTWPTPKEVWKEDLGDQMARHQQLVHPVHSR